jgi:hypothetical protein
MAVDIKQTLTDNIKNEGLNLASGLFPGVIQTAIDYYLNGVTIPIGSGGSLTVSGTGVNLQLEMSPVAFEGEATANGATLQISGTGDYADAYIKVTFTKVSDSQVSIELDATMGDNLSWKLSDLWPGLLDMAPFNEVNFEKGQLTLTIDENNTIDFNGSGDLYYKSEMLAAGAIKIIYNGETTGTPDKSKISVLAGVVVESWSPGSIWSPLNDVTFKQSGLLFSSLPEATSATLTSLNLFNDSDVPSIVTGDFDVKEGVTFFTTLELDNFLAPLVNLIGKNQTLALYANSDLDNNLTLIAKYGASGFKPSSDAIFEFEGFELEWDIVVGKSYDLTAAASGKFYPPDGSEDGIELTLSGTIKPEEGDISVTLTIGDWVHPFGYDHLTVKEFYASVVMGAQAGGVTIQAGGDFQFTTDDQNTFEFGVAAEITDFEVVTGIAFLLKDTSPGQEITIGDLINGITSIDTSSIPGIDFINTILTVKNVDFAVVEGASLHIGDKVFNQGFTANADFDVLEQTEIIIDVEITGSGTDEKFSGLAQMVEAVKIGEIFTLSGYDNVKKIPDLTKGPMIAVASDGIVVKGVNNDQPVYFYANGYIKVLDVIEDYLYGIATKDGLFEFTLSVQEGVQVGNSGTWGGYTVSAGLNPETYSFHTSFDFNFGWKNVSIGPLSVFGVQLIPEVSLPNFSISAGLGVFADGKNMTFELMGELTFDFLGINFEYGSYNNMKTIFKIDLSQALTSLSDIKDAIWSWLLNNIAGLLADAFDQLSKFVDWVKQNMEKLFLDAKQVAEIIYKEFTKITDDIANALKDIGYAASQVYDALVNGLNVLASEAEKIVDSIFDAAKKCAVDTAAALGTN